MIFDKKQQKTSLGLTTSLQIFVVVFAVTVCYLLCLFFFVFGNAVQREMPRKILKAAETAQFFEVQ